MLQPDEIIINKEWHQLDGAEKELLKELADSEAAFNLLKKMLTVSAEETNEVPAVSPAVYQEIITALPARKINIKRYGYAAAAAIVIVITASLFLFKKEDKAEFVKTTNTPIRIDSANKTNDVLVKQGIDTPVNKKRPDTIFDDRPLVKSKKPTTTNMAPSFNIPDTTLQDTYSVQITVASDPSLLNFISEAE